MKNQTETAQEPIKPEELISTAAHSAAHSGGVVSGSIWLIDDDRHRQYYVGYRINGKAASMPSGIEKRPVRTDKQEAKEAYEKNKLLIKEIVLKANQILKTHISIKEAQQQITSVINRAVAAACNLSFVQFAVPWVRSTALAKKLSLTVVLTYCRVVDSLATVLQQTNLPGASLGCVTGDHIRLSMAAHDQDSPSTWNKYLMAHRAIFNDAIAQNYLALNPAHQLKLRNGKSIERLPFSLDELDRILTAMDGMGELGKEWKRASFLSLNLGARRGDVLKRCRGEFDLKTRTTKLKPGKNEPYDRELVLPISEPLYAVLSAMPPGRPEDLLCPTLSQREGPSLSSSFNIILRRAKIEVPRTKRADGKGRRAVTQKSFYGFRHTLNFWLEVAGASREKRKDMLGQTTDKAQEHYRHQKAESLRQELDKVPQLKVLLQKFSETATQETTDYEI